MYKLDEHFQIDDTLSKTKEAFVVKGDKYRFSVLSDTLIRLEYSEDGKFVDSPSIYAQNRNFQTPNVTVKEDPKYLEIQTPVFRLFYIKNKPLKGSIFNKSSNLRIELVDTERAWYYNHPEVRNYRIQRDNEKKRKTKYKTLYSKDGFVSIDDTNGMLFNSNGEIIKRENTEIDIYVYLYNDNFNACLNDFYNLTGKPMLVPRYALGNWWDKREKYNDESLKTLIDKFEFEEIPISVLLLSHHWHVNTYKEKEVTSGFTFNEEYFKNPSMMIKYLHSKGIRLGLSIDPLNGIYPYEPAHSKFKEVFNIDEEIIPFNAFDTKFIDGYLKLIIRKLDATKVDFYFMNGDFKNKKEELKILSHYHYKDMTRDYQRRSLIVTPNNKLNPHKTSILYSGESNVSWKSLKTIPFYNSNSTNYGFNWWTHDIGGFKKGKEDAELFTRYVQLGVFSPILRLSSESGKYYKREPWKWEMKTSIITRKFLNLRHKLIPYLYSEAYKYHKEGTPIIKPFFYEKPEFYDDPIYKNEYYFGNEFFIAPIINQKEPIMDRVIQKFYLPEGIWFDFFTGKKYAGEKRHVGFYREEDYPVFVRPGSLIMLGHNENMFDTTPPKTLEIHVFPGNSGKYELYEDDGQSDIYKKGFYLKSEIQYNYMKDNYTVIVRPTEGKSKIVPELRNYIIRFRNTKMADDVVVYSKDKLVESESYVDKLDFIVKINNVSSLKQLTINCKGKDIEFAPVQIINEEIEAIINDLDLETEMKEKIDKVVFSEEPIKKRRIKLRRIKKLERNYKKLFLKLLEYVDIS